MQQFEEDGLIDYAGDVRFDRVYENIYRLFEKYQDSDLRKKRSMKMQQVIDGRGAVRIAELFV